MIHVGDCLEVMRTLDANSVDAIVTDPPYGLEFMGKDWDAPWKAVSGGFSAPGIGERERAWPSYKGSNLSRCAECGLLVGQGGSPCRCEHPKPKRQDAVRMRAFQAWCEGWATEALRVAKPGAYLAAFGGTRTFHRLACAIEDAGWEIRDTLMWVYSSGFPKSHNLDKLRGTVFCDCEAESPPERDLRSVRDADVSAAESTAEKRRQVLQQGVQKQGASQHGFAWPEPEIAGAKQPRVEGRSDDEAPEGKLLGGEVRPGAGMGEADGARGRLHHGAPAGDGADLRVPVDPDGGGRPFGSQPFEQPPVELGAVSDECGSQEGRTFPVCSGCGKPNPPRGLGTALKPAWEPIVLARKPLIGTVEANWREYGTGALNIDGCRVLVEGEDRAPVTGRGGIPARNDEAEARAAGVVAQPHELGRWPANLVHDGSDEVVALFPNVASGQPAGMKSGGQGNAYGTFAGGIPVTGFVDSGSAARFFYCAKADRADRNDGCDGMPRLPSLKFDPTSAMAKDGRRGDGIAENNHPTVKPTDLMRWLCRLVTPTGGLVLDPFAGSGSTGRGAIAEGFRFVGIELDPDYARIAEARIRAVQPGLALGAV